jgi:hypothetical protein
MNVIPEHPVNYYQDWWTKSLTMVNKVGDASRAILLVSTCGGRHPRLD